MKARRTLQILFVLLNIWICTEFYFFVRQFEVPGAAAVARPAGVEGWLPIAGLMNLKYALATGSVPPIHPAAMFLLASFLLMSLLLRKSFCGWLCPVGTLSEYLWKSGRKVFGRNFAPPRWLDIGLRGLKYLLLGFFVYAVGGMSALAIREFLESPYGIVADVKMLNFFRYMSTTSAIVLGVLLIGSIFVKNLWCRYLCPYGALLGLAALASPAKIRRDTSLCIDCGECARACPTLLPVDKLIQVRSAECIGCLECIESCPVPDSLFMGLPNRRAVTAWQMAAVIVVIFIGVTGIAKATGHWASPIPDAVFRELAPRAAEFAHPR